MLACIVSGGRMEDYLMNKIEEMDKRAQWEEGRSQEKERLWHGNGGRDMPTSGTTFSHEWSKKPRKSSMLWPVYSRLLFRFSPKSPHYMWSTFHSHWLWTWVDSSSLGEVFPVSFNQSFCSQLQLFAGWRTSRKIYPIPYTIALFSTWSLFGVVWICVMHRPNHLIMTGVSLS